MRGKGCRHEGFLGCVQGSEISTPCTSVTSLSEETLRYLDTHQHLLPGGAHKKAASSAATRSRVASLRRLVSALHLYSLILWHHCKTVQGTISC